jgi:hypothetical protein
LKKIMDCEKFDQVLIDALYDELDELTLAAAKRHAESCQRCQAAWSGLRATLKVGVLPTAEPPPSLEPNILQAAREAHGSVPWPKRMGRAISWAGSYAMRPQTAMAAILVLMLGSSVIFVRRKPDRGPSRVSVTERGVPEQAADEMRSEKIGIAPALRSASRGNKGETEYKAAPGGGRETPASESPSEGRVAKGNADKAQNEPAAEAPAAAPMAARARSAPADDSDGVAIGGTPGGAGVGALSDSTDEFKRRAETNTQGSGPFATPPAAQARDAYGAAMDLYTAGRYPEAERAFSDVAASGAKNAANAALYSAKSTESAYGCGRAASKYEAVAQHYTGTSAAAEAQWGAANCYKQTGNLDRAHALYNNLRSVAGYRDRAEGELENLKILQQQVAAKASRAAPPAKPAAPASPPAQAAPPQATSNVKPSQ